MHDFEWLVMQSIADAEMGTGATAPRRQLSGRRDGGSKKSLAEPQASAETPSENVAPQAEEAAEGPAVVIEMTEETVDERLKRASAAAPAVDEQGAADAEAAGTPEVAAAHETAGQTAAALLAAGTRNEYDLWSRPGDAGAG